LSPEQLIENEEDYKRYLELDDEAKKGIWAGGMPYEEDIVYTGSPITFDLRLYEGTGNYTGRAELKFTIVGMAHVTTTWDEVLEIFGYRKYDNTAVPTL